MAAELKRQRSIEAKLVPGSGGELEITLDGELIYSKRQTGRFPDIEEVLARLPK